MSSSSKKPDRKIRERALDAWSWSQVALGLARPFGGSSPPTPPNLVDTKRTAVVRQVERPARTTTDELVSQASDQQERTRKQRRDRAIDDAARDRLPVAAVLAPPSPESTWARSLPKREAGRPNPKRRER